MRRGYGLFSLLWTGVLGVQIPVGTYLITPADTPEVNALRDVVQKVHTDSGFVFLDNRCNLASFTLAPSLQWFTRLDLFECNALAELLDGGLVVGGRSHNHIPALVRLNPFTGQVKWSYVYFNAFYVDYAWIEDVTVTALGDLVVAGVYVPPGGVDQGWAARLDGSGQVLWMRTFRTPDTASSLTLRFVEVLPSGNLLFAGEYEAGSGYARPCHGIRILRHGVRLDSPQPYRVLRVDGRRVREGTGRWIPLSSGVFLIQTPGHTHRVVIP